MIRKMDYKPLLYWRNNLVMSKYNTIYLLTHDHCVLKIAKIRRGLFSYFVDNIKLLRRLMRSDIIASAVYSDFMYFIFNKSIYSVNANGYQVEKEYSFYRGRGPLSLSVIDGVFGFDDGVYFGEYFSNPKKDAVSIYKKSNDGSWISCYRFCSGEINHIHKLVPDIENKCVWILTGDFGNAAAIWCATENFNKVELIVGGEQKFRACVAFPYKSGLLYATDTQFQNNSIRILAKKNDKWESVLLSEIKGPSIYGMETSGFYIFSTSTEPGERKKGKLFSLIDNRPGPGIKDNSSDVIVCNKNTLDCSVVLTRNKDMYPYRLFQFGVIMFPSGLSHTNIFHMYNVGSINNDMNMEIHDIDNLVHISGNKV